MVRRPFKGLVKLDRKYHGIMTMTDLTRAVGLVSQLSCLLAHGSCLKAANIMIGSTTRVMFLRTLTLDPF